MDRFTICDNYNCRGDGLFSSGIRSMRLPTNTHDDYKIMRSVIKIPDGGAMSDGKYLTSSSNKSDRSL